MSSCVTARGVPPDAWQLLLSCLRLGGGGFTLGGVPLSWRRGSPVMRYPPPRAGPVTGLGYHC